MKLRFGIDAAADARIRATLDATCPEPPVGRRLSDVYLDTPDQALAEHGVALRFRRTSALGLASPTRGWRRQVIWPKGRSGSLEPKKPSLKTLGIPRLKRQLDATFNVRIDRWTWTLEDGWAEVSLDFSAVSTGRAEDAFTELRITCRKRDIDAAMHFAVELGAMHLSSTKARDRGRVLLGHGTGGYKP